MTTLTPAQIKFLEAVGPLRRTLVERAFKAELSPRQAIKAQCITCSGSVTEEAENCRVTTCALFAYNPYRLKQLEDSND